MNQSELALLCDFYEFTMSSGYFKKNMLNKKAYFDMFFRNIPDNGGFAITAGLEQVADYVENLRFGEEEIEYLRAQKVFDENFLAYLKDFRFTGDIYAMPEGTPVFPHEPILIVRAPVVEAQLLETYVLMAVNHQSLIATKTNRIVRAAKGRPVMEFGARRAHGEDAAVLGARAAFIGGCTGTSCTLTARRFGIPTSGTMAHSWVLMFDSEYEAFKTYCELYPHGATLLADTYSVLSSGVPNAIKAFKEVLLPQGITDFAIRIDSGDIAYLSKRARRMLDEAGLTGCKIVATNALDEHLIQDLILQGAQVDAFGVGERLITSSSSPIFDGVYKLAAVESEDGKIIPKIKLSENTVKITTPHFKKVYRLYDRESGKAVADQVCAFDETINENKPLMLFDPDIPRKTKLLENYTAHELLVPVFKNGVRVYKTPEIGQIQAYCREQVGLLWDEVKRFDNPHRYYVDLSHQLWRLKNDLIDAHNTDLHLK